MASIKKREIFTLLGCLGGATILFTMINIIQHVPARELFAKFHWVLLLAVVFYGITVILRGLYYLIARFWMRK